MEPAAAALGQTLIAIDGAATARRAGRPQRTSVERKGYAATATPPDASAAARTASGIVEPRADTAGWLDRTLNGRETLCPSC